MIRSIFISALLCAALTSYAQWNPNGATSGSIYYNGGNVGIGRQDPQYLLDVVGVIRSSGYLRITGINETAGLIADDGWGSTIFSITRQANNETRFQSYGFQTFYSGNSAGSEKMRIAANGNVGIGSTSPVSRLSIEGGDLQVSNQGRFKGWNSGGSTGLGLELGISENKGVILAYDRTNNAFSDLRLTGKNGNNTGVTIKTDGNVGIENQTPQALLHIGTNNLGLIKTVRMALEPPQHSGANWEFSVRDDPENSYLGIGYGAEQFTINHNGNVSIGTQASTAKLQVTSGEDARKTFRVYNVGSTSNYLNIWHGTSAGVIDVIGSGKLILGYDQPTDVYLSTAGGNVGIGTTNPDAKLAVKGTIHAEEVKVDLSVPGPDYVFEPDYNLSTLTEIETYIKANKHLPEVPSAKEMETNGINLSEMNMLLLKKVEELTLHLIEQNRSSQEQKKLIETLLIEVEKLKNNK